MTEMTISVHLARPLLAHSPKSDSGRLLPLTPTQAFHILLSLFAAEHHSPHRCPTVGVVRQEGACGRCLADGRAGSHAAGRAVPQELVAVRGGRPELHRAIVAPHGNQRHGQAHAQLGIVLSRAARDRAGRSGTRCAVAKRGLR
jgi:hypothetical protein